MVGENGRELFDGAQAAAVSRRQADECCRPPCERSAEGQHIEVEFHRAGEAAVVFRREDDEVVGIKHGGGGRREPLRPKLGEVEQRGARTRRAVKAGNVPGQRGDGAAGAVRAAQDGDA